MGFFGIDFGQGIANPEYMHPSIEVQDVFTAIERYNGITIDGKERLYGGLTYPLLLPLVSKTEMRKVEKRKQQYANCRKQHSMGILS